MIRFVALLRGINLGNRRLKMEELRRHFEALDGVEDPSTYLASGNVIFDGAAFAGDGAGTPDDLRRLEERIEAHLRSALGYEVDTFVRPLAALDSLVRSVEDRVEDEGKEEGGQSDRREGARAEENGGHEPAGEPVKPHVIFLREDVGGDEEAALRALETPDDRFRVLGREVAWLRRGRLSDSSIEPRHLEKALGGRTHTMRTLNTVRRIVKKFGG